MNKKSSQDISFGEWLRQRRHILDLTQQELADQVGCARITLRRIETGALKPSKELARILLETLGIPPEQHTMWLRFARGLSGLPGSAIASFTKPAITNLPALLTNFIGREKECQQIVHLIGKSPLVTLVGPGGVGKTRLALQVAQDLSKTYPDGMWLVELASILEPLLVPRLMANTIGLRDESQRSLIDLLCDYLRQKEMLLILDECEHLVDACARLAEKILNAAPKVHILATSREALGIPGEISYRVESLRLPDMRQLPPIALLSKYEAVALFIDRATMADPSFRVTNHTVKAIAEICHHLDGVPLAIELAAAKLRVLNLEQINERLADRFRLLAGGSRTASPQHQTLQAAMDWSYDLLPTAEQALFQRLAIFSGGWTLEAAETVCSDTDIRSEDILNLLTELINKSLVNREETISETRYSMLETIREYALKKLNDSGEINIYRLRHLMFFAKLAEEAERNFKGRHQAIWYSRLDHELDNLRAAMTSFDGLENVEVRLGLATGLWRYWKNRGYTREGREHLQRVLADLPSGPMRQTTAYAGALNAVGSLAYYEGDFSYSDQTRTEALVIFQNLADKAGIANCLNGLGNTAISHGNYDAARRFYEESLLLRRDLGDQWGIARLLGNLGLIAYFQMDFAQAHSLHSESLNLFQELGDEEGIANELVNLGDLARQQDELTLARSLYRSSAMLSAKLMDQWGLGYALMGMGDVALAQGDPAGAAFLYRDCLLIFQKGVDYAGLPFALESVAALALERSQPQNAARILGAADAMRKNTNAPLPAPNRPAYEKVVTLLHQLLDKPIFDHAWAEGRAMNIDRVITLALEEVA